MSTKKTTKKQAHSSVENKLLADVLCHGALALRAIPREAHDLVTGPARALLDCVAELVREGTIMAGPVDLTLIEERIEWAAGPEAAKAARDVMEDVLLTFRDLVDRRSTAAATASELLDLNTVDQDDRQTERPDLADLWRPFALDELKAAPPEKDFIWAGRIPYGDVGSLAGGGGTGKTTFITGLACHMALGRPFLGHAVRQGTTVILSTEDGRTDYLRKIKAWSSSMGGFDVAEVARHFMVLDLAGVPFRLVRVERGDFAITEDVGILTGLLRSKAPKLALLVIETVSRMGGDEGNAALSTLVCACEQVSRSLGCTVLLVSHVSKASFREKSGDQYSARGGGAISDNGRFSITLTPLDATSSDSLVGRKPDGAGLANWLVLRVPKINSAPPPEPIVLARVPTKHGAVFRVVQPASPEEKVNARLARSHEVGRQLERLAARCAAEGRPITLNRLANDLRSEIDGLKKKECPSAVEQAIADGFLHRVRNTGHGGGWAFLPNGAPVESAIAGGYLTVPEGLGGLN